MPDRLVAETGLEKIQSECCLPRDSAFAGRKSNDASIGRELREFIAKAMGCFIDTLHLRRSLHSAPTTARQLMSVYFYPISELRSNVTDANSENRPAIEFFVVDKIATAN